MNIQQSNCITEQAYIISASNVAILGKLSIF